MGDAVARKSAAMSRLRNNLKKKKESLADEFDFRMYITIQFKDEKKKSVLFEVDEVMSVMTNNYEQDILRNAGDDSYSYESSKTLLDKDIVQFHAHKWLPLRQDGLGGRSAIDYFLWPRNDIDCIQCHLFSKWKGEHEPFRPLDVCYQIKSSEYEEQIPHLLLRTEKPPLIATNTEQTVFLFLDKQQLQTSKNGVTVFKLQSVCVYLSQDHLMMWKSGTVEELVAGHFFS